MRLVKLYPLPSVPRRPITIDKKCGAIFSGRSSFSLRPRKSWISKILNALCQTLRRRRKTHSLRDNVYSPFILHRNNNTCSSKFPFEVPSVVSGKTNGGRYCELCRTISSWCCCKLSSCSGCSSRPASSTFRRCAQRSRGATTRSCKLAAWRGA